ncbi:class I SAM-dependent methyltransferase [Beggiatoa leptomitoformis]|uniref:Methyltransferase domain-containing protein n=1 Tax=Beggiatoa leptomitoformis TaxID=288004 RepID=A0A2N9YD20_9GAMM|nr:class I SAM-dependent methyltransferase [Beggiatoa leptomitoformis]ALG69217.1 methyltransferase domain-containing protein [Beggiatoa leptomitoformis]AUI68347.1 methyltransferase domain-containing protein [Beggiatoa leptomitoformis]
MDRTSVINAYKRYANIYDHVFGWIFHPGRMRSVEQMRCQTGDSVLEVGAGTGLSLPLYPPDVVIIGIDISPHMLSKAKILSERDGLENVAFAVADAQLLCFPDNTFDKVVAMYVASVVPDPQTFVAEIKRVCKPHGDIFFVNHFSHTNIWVRQFERFLTLFSHILGFRTDLSLDAFISQNQLIVKEITPINLFGYWSMVHAIND